MVNNFNVFEDEELNDTLEKRNIGYFKEEFKADVIS